MMAWNFLQLRDAIIILVIAALYRTATPCLTGDEKERLLHTYETGDAASAVIVQEVISKLHSPQISFCDHRLLKRIALVETNNSVHNGGIWAVDERKYDIVASEVADILSDKLCLLISDGITYSLRQPLVSGLAAGLYLNHVENSENINIPKAENVEEQAKFWINHYHSKGLQNVDCFVGIVKRRDGKLCNLPCITAWNLVQFVLQHVICTVKTFGLF